jgi:hypothetical protein
MIDSLLANTQRLESQHHVEEWLEYRTIPVDIGGGDNSSPISCASVRTIECRRSSITIRWRRRTAVDFRVGAISVPPTNPASSCRKPRRNARVLQWVHWQMANLGPIRQCESPRITQRTLRTIPNSSNTASNDFVGEVDRPRAA